jgi:hypothetical protein
MRKIEKAMWWLSFRDGGAVIISASSLVHARLLAAANGLGRASLFVEGNLIDTARLPPIPPEFVGRTLSSVDARRLLEVLNDQSQHHHTGRRPGTPDRGRPTRS